MKIFEITTATPDEVDEYEYKISKLLQEQIVITESEAQDLAQMICEMMICEIKKKLKERIRGSIK